MFEHSGNAHHVTGRSVYLGLAGAVILLPLPGIARAAGDKPTVTAPEHRWAVLISISNYDRLAHFPSRTENMARLRESLIQAGFPDNQVRLMNDTLQDPLLRPTKANLQRQLAWLRGELPANETQGSAIAALTSEDEVVLAVAMCGFRHADRQYLCPIDAVLPRSLTAESLSQSLLTIEAVRDAMSSCKAGRKLLVLNLFEEDPRPGARGAAATDDLEGVDVARLRAPRGYGELIGRDERQIEAKDVGGFLNVVISGLQGQADFFGTSPDRWVGLAELAEYVQKQAKLSVKSVTVGEDFPLGRVQGQPPPPITARHDVLIRLGTVLLNNKLYDPAIDSSSRAVRTAGRDRDEAAAYAQRAEAHLGRGDFAAAVSDSRRAEQPLLAVAENYGRLQVEDQIVGTVYPGQKVTILDASGDFVAVSATLQDGRTVTGWLHRNSCPLKPPAALGDATSEKYEK